MRTHLPNFDVVFNTGPDFTVKKKYERARIVPNTINRLLNEFHGTRAVSYTHLTAPEIKRFVLKPNS